METKSSQRNATGENGRDYAGWTGKVCATGIKTAYRCTLTVAQIF
jgi:hypothetical protein